MTHPMRPAISIAFTRTHGLARRLPFWTCLLFMLMAIPVAAQAAVAGEAPPPGFGTIDWLVVVVYALALIGIGFFYSRRQTTTEEYFVGSRSVAPFLAGISLYATMFSAVTYIALPGEMIQHGPVLICVGLMAMPFIYLIVGYWIIPLMMRLPVTSAYELLETRLGRHVRLLGSGIFVVTRLIWMALMLHITALVLITVMGWDPGWKLPLIIITGGLTVLYTLIGGFRAVVVSDVVQFFVFFVGLLFTLIYITVSMGGVGAWWPAQWAEHWAPQPFFSFDPGVRITMVGTFVGAVIWWICTSASDQMAIQRYLSTRDAAAARRAFLHSTLGATAVPLLLGLVGLAVLGFFLANPALLPAHLSLTRNGDALFPHFVSHFLPVGAPGLILAGLLAATMSSLSSGINSISAVVSKDFLENRKPGGPRTDANQVKVARLLAAGIGLAVTGGSQVMGIIPGNLVEVGGKSVNLFVCPLFGLFFLALFVPFATPFGAIMGAAYSLAAATLVGYWDLLTGRPPVSFQWIAPVALATSLVCGCLFSLLPTRGKPGKVLAAYAVAALLPWPALFLILR